LKSCRKSNQMWQLGSEKMSQFSKLETLNLKPKSLDTKTHHICFFINANDLM